MGDIFAKIPLEISKIDKVIKKYPDCEIDGPRKMKGGYHRYVATRDGNYATIDFYFRGDGLTTINWQVGTCQQLSKEIASYVKEKCLVRLRENQPISLKAFPRAHCDELIHYLCDDIGALIKNTVADESLSKVTLQGPYKDTITLTHYKNGTFLLQGRPLHLFNEARSYLSVILQYEGIIEEQIKTLGVDIDKQAIHDEFESLYPRSCDYLDEITKIFLRTAITFKKVSIPIDDYSSLAFPALKGLECYLKQLFLDHEIIITKQDGFGEHMAPSGDSFVLKLEAKKRIPCDLTRAAIEKAYQLYHKERHSLFHAEGIVSSTRLIESQAEADIIVDSILRIIESTCPSKHNG